MVEKLMVKQLANTIPADLHIWLAERKSATGAEAWKLADDYLHARRHVSLGKLEKKERSSNDFGDARKCHKCGVVGHLKKNCPVKEEVASAANPHNGFKSSDRRSTATTAGNMGMCPCTAPRRPTTSVRMVGDGQWLGQD